MPKAKPLSKQLIVGAMNKTKSNRAASRYLGVSYIHYKKWARNYDSKTHENLFEQHKNQCGKGIPKFLNNGKAFVYFLFLIKLKTLLTISLSAMVCILFCSSF